MPTGRCKSRRSSTKAGSADLWHLPVPRPCTNVGLFRQQQEKEQMLGESKEMGILQSPFTHGVALP